MTTPQDKVPNSTIYDGTIKREKIQNNAMKYSESYEYSIKQQRKQKNLEHYRKTNIYLSKRPELGGKWSQERHLMTHRNDLTTHNNKINEQQITFTHPITATRNDIANMEEELEHPKIGITVWTSYQPKLENEITEEIDPLSLVETTTTSNKDSVGKIPPRNLKCIKCDKNFLNILTRNKHILRQHITVLKHAPCPQCNVRSNDLNLHMKDVHNVEGNICPYCTKTFSAKNSLNRHIDTIHMHIQPHRPAPCPYCNKKLNQKQTLKKHIEVVHLGKRNYSDPCPHCGKIFTTEGSLNAHISNVHLKQKTKCRLCNKELSYLRNHMNIVHGVLAKKPKIPVWAIEGLFTPVDDELDRTVQNHSQGNPL